MCQFLLVVALETALHSLWLCGLPEDISPLATNGSYGNANAMVLQCARERRGTRQAPEDEVMEILKEAVSAVSRIAILKDVARVIGPARI